MLSAAPVCGLRMCSTYRRHYASITGVNRWTLYETKLTRNSGPHLLWTGPCSEKCGGPSPIFPGNKLATFLVDHRPCVSCQFSWKTGDLFLIITVALFVSLLHSGVPPFVGPQFGRTCWTCLNPSLKKLSYRKHVVRRLHNVEIRVLHESHIE